MRTKPTYTVYDPIEEKVIARRLGIINAMKTILTYRHKYVLVKGPYGLWYVELRDKTSDTFLARAFTIIANTYGQAEEKLADIVVSGMYRNVIPGLHLPVALLEATCSTKKRRAHHVI